MCACNGAVSHIHRSAVIGKSDGASILGHIVIGRLRHCVVGEFTAVDNYLASRISGRGSSAFLAYVKRHTGVSTLVVAPDAVMQIYS